MTYSIIGILAALILLIINRDVLWNLNGSGASRTRRCYRQFLVGVLIYYITDILWGLLERPPLQARGARGPVRDPGEPDRRINSNTEIAPKPFPDAPGHHE